MSADQNRIATIFRDLSGSGSANKLNPYALYEQVGGNSYAGGLSKTARMKADNAALQRRQSAAKECERVESWKQMPGTKFSDIMPLFLHLTTLEAKVQGAIFLLSLALKEESLVNATDVALCLAKLERLVTLNEDNKKTLKQLYKKLGKLYGSAEEEADKNDEEGPDPIAMQFNGDVAMAPANPLSREQFEGLDPWQSDLLGQIFLTGFQESFLVTAATGAGKTRIMIAVCQKLASNGKKTVFIVPSQPVAWQVAGYLRDLSVPIKLVVDDFIHEERDWSVLVGTPTAVENILLDVGNTTFTYAVYDEIHSLDAPMERLMYLVACPFVALSATLARSEAERIAHFWMERLGIRVNLFEHNARYINLTRHVWTGGRLKKMHPLSTLTVQDIRNGAFDKMSLGFTPADCWLLSVALHNLDIEVPADAIPEEFFENHKEHIHLDDVKKLEQRMKQALIGLADEQLEKILRSLRVDLTQISHGDEMLPLALALKKKNMAPAVIFSQSPAEAAQHFVRFIRDCEQEQDRVYPNYPDELLQKARLFKDFQTRRAALAASKVGRGTRFPTGMDLERALQDFDKQEEDKMMLGLSQVYSVDLDAPHPDYSFSRGIVESTVEQVKKELKEAFGIAVGTQSAVIAGLVRGVGVITGDMTTEQQLIVQKLVQKGYIRVLFSDRTWAYGVNMPFRTAVLIVKEGDSMSPLLAQQMEGRAGRRGFDYEGHVVYVGANPTPFLKREYGQVTGDGDIWCHAIPSLPQAVGMRLNGPSLGGMNEFPTRIRSAISLYREKSWMNQKNVKILLWNLRDCGDRVLHVPELLERFSDPKDDIKDLTTGFILMSWIVEGDSHTGCDGHVPKDILEKVHLLLAPISACQVDTQLGAAFLGNTYGEATQKERTELNIRMIRIMKATQNVHNYQGRKIWVGVIRRIMELVRKNTIIHGLE